MIYLRDAVELGSNVCKDFTLSRVRCMSLADNRPENELDERLVLIYQDSAIFRGYLLSHYLSLGEWFLCEEATHALTDGWEWLRLHMAKGDRTAYAVGLSEVGTRLVVDSCRLTSSVLQDAGWVIGKLPFTHRFHLWGNETPVDGTSYDLE